MRTASRYALGLLASLLTIIAVTLGVAGSATAHDELEKSSPANGADVKHLPKQLTMTFAEETGSADVTVKYGAKVLPVGQAPGHTKTVTVDLSSITTTGRIALSWKAVDSHDGHTTRGILTFHVATHGDAGASIAHSKVPTDPRSLTWLSVSAHIVGYLAMALLIGGLFFITVLWPEGAGDARTRGLLVTAVVAGIIAALCSVLVEIRRAGTTPRSDVLLADYGRVATAAVLLWILAAVVVVAVLQMGPSIVRTLPWQIGALVVALGIIRVTGMTAHATQSQARTLGIVADFLHLSAMSAWVGGLAVMSFGLLPRRRLAEIEEVVPRFSKVAMVSVLMIISSGLIMLYQIGVPVGGFWTTHYSRILLVKLAALAAVLVAAMFSKRWVDTFLGHSAGSLRGWAVRSFAASVGAETALVIAVLTVASVLVTSSPGA